MMKRRLFPRIVVLLPLLAGLSLPAHAGLTQNGGCVDDVTATYYSNRVPTNCTANDVTFVLVGLGTQTDGCVSTSDTVGIYLRAEIQNTTAQTRYDIGMYMAQDGDPNGDGATTGTCARASLDPLGATGQTACPPLDLDGPLSGNDLNVVGVADGPFLSAETGGNNSTPDSCGDLFSQGNSGCDENADGLYDDSVYEFPQAVSFPCRDVEGDGFVNIPTCATWGNQADEVHTNAANDVTCESQAEVIPGTKAKCRCEDSNTDIPLPSLALSCSCNRANLNPGESATCSVTYTNSSSCTPDLNTPERFRCGTAGYLRYRVDYPESRGSVSGISVSGSGGGGSALDTTESGNQLIRWTPASGLGTAGILGPGESATLTYTFTLDAGAPYGQTDITTTAYWSDVSGFSPEVAQSTLTCGISFTPVTLASFQAREQGEETVVEWTTATETGNVGFNLYAETAEGWVRVNREPIPSQAVDSTRPLRYRYRVENLAAKRFALEDVDLSGKATLRGTFEPGETRGVAPRPEALDWPAIRRQAEAAEARGLAERRGGPGAAQAVTLRVDRDGLYRLSYEELAAAGFDLAGVQADHLALTNRGEPVPLRVEGPRRFGPGSFVELWGEGLDTLYTRTNVYTLSADRPQARRVGVDGRTPAASAPVAPFYLETAVFERDLGYSFTSPLDDPWYDTRLLTFTSPASWNLPFQVDHLVSGAAPASLAVELWGSTVWDPNPDHHLLVSVNGVPLADERFDGRTPHSVEVELPPGLLQEGGNTLTLELPGDLGVPFDLVYLDRFQVTYPRAFVAWDGGLRFRAAGEAIRVVGLPTADPVVYRLDGSGPVRLAGVAVEPAGAGAWTATFPGTPGAAEYVLATAGARLTPELRAVRPDVDLTSGRADYLILSHPAFLASLGPLVDHHRAQGLSVKVVDVEDVYQQLGDGIFDPQPIRDYIAYAAERMGTRYVLLVGGDTYDYHDALGLGSVSFIPSPYAATDDLVTFAPVDPLYADVDGDRVPDLAIGRLPVRTTGELEAVLAKILEYAGKSYDRTAVFAADAFDAAGNVSFTQESEDFIRGLGWDWDVGRAFIDLLGEAGARSVLVDAIEEGVALTSFIGHSGPTLWTFGSLFSSADAQALGNAGRPTVVVQWGCWNTYHVEPRFNTLGHTFLLSGDRGAAAVLGSATLLATPSAEALGERLAPRLAAPGVRLGDAVTAAKQALARERPGLYDVLLGWTLLGDPALVINP